MGRPKLGAEYKKPSDYIYDYPENRKVSRHLTIDDKHLISARTGFSYSYVSGWCRGERRSRPIEEWARRIARLNQAKQRKLEKLTTDNA